MSTLVRTAIQLNQDGANHFVRSNMNVALECYREALTTMIRFEPPVNNDMETPAMDATHFTARGISYLPVPPEKDVTTGDPFIYCRPFVFDQELLPQNQDGIAIFSAIVVFNMAIIFHQKSFSEPSRGGLELAKALNLYESSVSLFLKVSARFDLSGTVAVALNNKASLFFGHDDFESCDQELERLQGFMVRAEYSTSTAAVLKGSDFQGIMLNLLTMRAPQMAHAA